MDRWLYTSGSVLITDFWEHELMRLEAPVWGGQRYLHGAYCSVRVSLRSLPLDTMHTVFSFGYDQMGRLTRARTLAGFDGSQWNAYLTNQYSTRYRYDLVGNILELVRYDGLGNLLDSLRYDYYDLYLNNRLKSISDAVSTQFPYDLESQPSVNYFYDPVGNMVRDVSSNLSVRYNYSNRPKLLILGNNTIRMLYNPAGYRFFKGTDDKGDIFIYNTQGQLIAKYSLKGDTLKLDFLPIYEGTRRLGIYEPEGVEWVAGSGKFSLLPHIYVLPCLNCPMQLTKVKRYALKPTRKYELTDHLGNVRVVIADQRVPVPDSSGQVVAYYKPKVVGIYDYYPFGWLKPLAVDSYPFTYQGQLLDSELGWQYYRYRNYDPVVGRFWQVEPMVDSFGWWSGYGFVNNMVTYGIEQEGLWILMIGGIVEGGIVIGGGGEWGLLITGDYRGVTGVYLYSMLKGGLYWPGAGRGLAITWYPGNRVYKPEHVEGWGWEGNIGIGFTVYVSWGATEGSSLPDEESGINLAIGGGTSGTPKIPIVGNIAVSYTWVWDVDLSDIDEVRSELRGYMNAIERIRERLEDLPLDEETCSQVDAYLSTVYDILTEADEYLRGLQDSKCEGKDVSGGD